MNTEQPGQSLTLENLFESPSLTNYPLIIPEAENSEHNRVIKSPGRHGVYFDQALEVGTIETVKRFVEQGLGSIENSPFLKSTGWRS